MNEELSRRVGTRSRVARHVPGNPSITTSHVLLMNINRIYTAENILSLEDEHYG